MSPLSSEQILTSQYGINGPSRFDLCPFQLHLRSFLCVHSRLQLHQVTCSSWCLIYVPSYRDFCWSFNVHLRHFPVPSPFPHFFHVSMVHWAIPLLALRLLNCNAVFTCLLSNTRGSLKVGTVFLIALSWDSATQKRTITSFYFFLFFSQFHSLMFMMNL